MHDAAIVVARPPDATQLVLLFHGVGSSAASLVPLGAAIAHARPQSVVVSVDAPHPSPLGSGRQWFSVVGITEQNRPERIANAMPLFREAVTHWQRITGIPPEATALVGFSQGAILSLEGTQAEPPVPAGRVVALAGRFAERVRRLTPGLRYHLIHGEDDPVVPARSSSDAARGLRALGGDVTVDLLPGLGHGIDARAVALAIGHLA